MFEIYLRNGVIDYQNDNHKDVDLDIDFDESRSQMLDVFIGYNGVGKSFLCQNVVNLAFLYKIKPFNQSNLYSLFIQSVIKRLAESKIGDFASEEEVPPSTSDKIVVSLYSSYNPQITDSSSSADLTERTKRCYFFTISERTKKLFDKWNFSYYSNSHFPSNIPFFSPNCSSFEVKDIDLIFWKINLDERKDLKIVFNINKSGWKINPSWEINQENFIKGTKNWKEFWDNFYYKNRNIFLFLNNSYSRYSYEKIFESKLFNDILSSAQTEAMFPSFERALDKITIDDYIAIKVFKEVFNTFDYELHSLVNKEYVPYKVLNSGKKYDLHLSILTKMYGEKTILFIDEPENSLHVTTQEKIAQESLKACKINLITHSPAFISSLVRRTTEPPLLHLLYQKEGDDNKVFFETIDQFTINTLSLDSVSAEYLGYAPFLDVYREKNESINPENMMSIDDFYAELRK